MRRKFIIIGHWTVHKRSEITIGTELPLWKSKEKNLLTGHLDIMFLFEGDTLLILDYKPDANGNPKTT